MKRRTLARAGTLAGAALLALTAPVLAFAATGTFAFETPDGAQEQIINPGDNACLNIDAYGPVENRTNRDAVLFDDADCHGANRTTLYAGQHAGFVDAQSVKFIR
ncbi:hypothetical protein [Kitasatospora sp. NPDC094011]|uniref:hypothetical protein n=1 Tax=Kitasatospora sp. NPDC094011 TaxID=3364090 RepID=UPI003818A93E